jgi:hypothetical protein
MNWVGGSFFEEKAKKTQTYQGQLLPSPDDPIHYSGWVTGIIST